MFGELLCGHGAKKRAKSNSISMTEEKKDVVVPEKFAKLVSEIEKMSVLDLSELVKVLEEKFGVSAAAPMMMGAMPAAAAEAAGGFTPAAGGGFCTYGDTGSESYGTHLSGTVLSYL